MSSENESTNTLPRGLPFQLVAQVWHQLCTNVALGLRVPRKHNTREPGESEGPDPWAVARLAEGLEQNERHSQQRAGVQRRAGAVGHGFKRLCRAHLRWGRMVEGGEGGRESGGPPERGPRNQTEQSLQ